MPRVSAALLRRRPPPPAGHSCCAPRLNRPSSQWTVAGQIRAWVGKIHHRCVQIRCPIAPTPAVARPYDRHAPLRLPHRGRAPPPGCSPCRHVSGRPRGFRRRTPTAARQLEEDGGGGVGS
ncbi:Os06g0556700 [Oryza sativa Japonica Group]|nr:Os06g0556700 [Oryza sativa Japonica Group]